MADRYIRKLEFDNDVYSLDCPIVLEKGAVLLDTKADAYLLQLKFANIGKEGISSAVICVKSLNGAKAAYPEITVKYDEYTVVGEAFGTKKLISIPNNNATVFRVYIDKITTIDGNTYTFSNSQYKKSTHKSTKHIADTMREIRMTLKPKEPQPQPLFWRAKRYHVVFAIIMLMIIVHIVFVNLVVWLILYLFHFTLLISAWIKIGTPLILKRTARMMILSPVGFILFDIIINFQHGFFSLREMIIGICYTTIFAAIPFVCVYLTAKRHDRSVSFKNALMFWRSH